MIGGIRISHQARLGVDCGQRAGVHGIIRPVLSLTRADAGHCRCSRAVIVLVVAISGRCRRQLR